MYVCQNEDGLFQCMINNNEDGIVTVRVRKFLNEIHGDRIPRAFRNWKWAEESVGFMTRRLVSSTSHTRPNIVLDKFTNKGPGVLPSYILQCLILTKMSHKDVVMVLLEDTESKVISIGNKDMVVKS